MINLLKTAQELFAEDTKKRNSSFIVDSIIGTILLAIKKYNESEANILIYAANNYDANQIYNKLSSLIDEDKIILLPGDDLIRVEYISESKEIRSELIYGLYKIRHAHHSIIIATPSTIYRYYPSVETFDNSFIDIHVGDDIDVNQLKNKLSLSRLRMFGQSTDSFLFYRLLRLGNYKKIRRLQHISHTKKTRDFFITLIEYIKENNLKDDIDTCSFLSGFICHYALDLTVHPYVFYKTGSFHKDEKETYKYNSLHTLMEVYLDNYLIWDREKSSPYNFPIVICNSSRKINRQLQ